MTDEGALERWARERPEAPFVFFRGRRGHFRWLSYAAARTYPPTPRPGAESEDWAPPEVAEIVEAARAERSTVPADGGIPGRTDGRDIWISWRPLSVPEEAALAAFAIRSGAAILAERCDRLPLELFLWARPTLVSGESGEIDALLEGLGSEAPRFLRRRWLRQRLGRLRLALVERSLESGDVDRIHRTIQSLLPGASASVRPFPRISA